MMEALFRHTVRGNEITLGDDPEFPVQHMILNEMQLINLYSSIAEYIKNNYPSVALSVESKAYFDEKFAEIKKLLGA